MPHAHTVDREESMQSTKQAFKHTANISANIDDSL